MQRYRIYLIPPLIILGVTGLALLGIQLLVFAPQERARVATATAQAQMLEYRAQGAATAMAAMATADALEAQTNLAGAATAQAATATAEAQQGAAALAATATVEVQRNRATATAQVAANKAVAEANRCLEPAAYTLDVAETPVLTPEPGYRWVTSNAWPSVYAGWGITNTGACAWQSVQLKTLAGETVEVKLSRDGEELSAVDPGASATVRLYFPRQAALTQGEWILVVNGLTLFDLPHLRLDLGEQRWMIAVAPTATPTPIPTPTPVPSKPTVCTTVCDKCEKCKNDEFGNTVCTQVDCNCRQECH
ncbi:MAG: hypothetical protein JXA21_23460 [Anaerolineae bacterium]|nr:hypothetical protein [Anaerolineae bacterium]